ncbi:MAG: double-strand break repair protein AddB [Alphaproteobacteria bacterium]
MTSLSGLYTIPAGEDFADALARGVMDLAGTDDPLALTQIQILLPTRRSCRTLREAFLRLADGKPLLLPRMDALGDPESDELELGAVGLPSGLGLPDEALRVEMPPISRVLILSRMVMAAGQDQGLARTPEQAVELAVSLARLLDEIALEERPLEDLASLPPADYAEHWQKILNFLKIIAETWPDYLQLEGAVDPGEKRRLLLHAQARLWEQSPPPHQVIIAGVTGSVPATRAVMRAVLQAPQGVVVLPGLDQTLEKAAWAELTPNHPQHGLRNLLRKLDHARDDVAPWPWLQAETLSDQHLARRHLLTEAMRPAATAEKWAELTLPADSTSGLSLVEADTAEEEAALIACMLRQTLQHKGQRAIVVTPDRTLARRISTQMQRFGVTVDDSAGIPLSETPIGSFLRLTLALTSPDADAFDILAALKHPLTAGGKDEASHMRFTRQLDLTVMRGPAQPPGLPALLAHAHNLRHKTAARRQQHRPQIESVDMTREDALIDWLSDLLNLTQPLSDAFASDEIEGAELLDLMISTAEALAATDDQAGPDRLWIGEAGEAMVQFIADFRVALAAQGKAIAPASFDPIMTGLMQSITVRPRYGTHPRLAILGPMEARLTRADRVIIAGMNDATWPGDVTLDPWLSRPMRQDYQLPQPDQKTGFIAHDFCQLACAPEVIMTRAKRQGNAPAVPSRWLTRLATVLESSGLPLLTENAAPWAEWRKWLDKPGKFAPAPRPCPSPPIHKRPTGLAVTTIERWLQDPYFLYAKEVLKLKPLEDVAQTVGAADRGNIVHAVFDQFLRDLMDQPFPPDAADRLRKVTVDVFSQRSADHPVVESFWQPRLMSVIDWFVATEADRRNENWSPIALEQSAEKVLDFEGHKFRLNARCDRLDAHPERGIAIWDYKTGGQKSKRDLMRGDAVQLTLTAMLVERGGFSTLGKGRPVSSLGYWYVNGLAEPGKLVDLNGIECATLIEEAEIGLSELLSHYRRETACYPARPRESFVLYHNDYRALSRESEWLVEADDEGY